MITIYRRCVDPERYGQWIGLTVSLSVAKKLARTGKYLWAPPQGWGAIDLGAVRS